MRSELAEKRRDGAVAIGGGATVDRPIIGIVARERFGHCRESDCCFCVCDREQKEEMVKTNGRQIQL